MRPGNQSGKGGSNSRDRTKIYSHDKLELRICTLKDNGVSEDNSQEWAYQLREWVVQAFFPSGQSWAQAFQCFGSSSKWSLNLKWSCTDVFKGSFEGSG